MGIALLFAVIPLVLLLISFGGLIVAWVLVFRGGGKTNADDLACCGSCGYPARGAVNFDCVECGADLREVGIVNLAQRKRPLGPLGFGLLWTFCLPIPALTAAGLAIAFGPQHTYSNEMATLTPNSGEYVSIDLDNQSIQNAFSTYYVTGLTPPGNISLSVAGNNNQYDWLEVDPVAMTYDSTFSFFTPPTSSANPTSANAVSSAPFDRAAALAWLKSAGADDTNPDVIAEADELIQIVQQQPAQGLANLSTATFQVTSQTSFPLNIPQGWWVVLCLLAVPAAWIAGGILYFFIYRKRTRHLPNARPSRDPHGPARFAPPSL
ncbi:MAG: hypothetical protein AAGH99_08775 [Planctomycetota bacterium]